MNACLAMNYSVFEVPQSYLESKIPLVLGNSDRTPAVTQIWGKTEKFFLAAIKASIEAESEGLGLTTPMLTNAFHLLSILAPLMPLADAYVSQAGSLVFDWDQDDENMISVILLNGNRVGWAAYFSGDRVHGSAKFGGQIPEELAGAISKWRRLASNVD